MLTNERLSEMAFNESRFIASIDTLYETALDVHRVTLSSMAIRAEENIVEAARQLEENLWREAGGCLMKIEKLRRFTVRQPNGEVYCRQTMRELFHFFNCYGFDEWEVQDALLLETGKSCSIGDLIITRDQ